MKYISCTYPNLKIYSKFHKHSTIEKNVHMHFTYKKKCFLDRSKWLTTMRWLFGYCLAECIAGS